VVMSAVSPLMPFVLDQVSVDSRWQTPITATWMLARVATVGLMWKLAFWHGRWGTLVASAACLALGFVGIIAAPSLAVVLAGLVVFGVGMGAVYFAALYYAMSVGRAEIDAGGRHEAAIGAGYAFGPMLGLLAIGLEGPEDAVASGDALSSEALLVALVALSALAAAWPAVRPYRRAFRRRRRSS